jgi:hypothetical protein
MGSQHLELDAGGSHTAYHQCIDQCGIGLVVATQAVWALL